MWIPLVLLPAAVVLSLLGAAATAFRSALLMLGEEGLSEAASAGDGQQADTIRTARRSSRRFATRRSDTRFPSGSRRRPEGRLGALRGGGGYALAVSSRVDGAGCLRRVAFFVPPPRLLPGERLDAWRDRDPGRAVRWEEHAFSFSRPPPARPARRQGGARSVRRALHARGLDGHPFRVGGGILDVIEEGAEHGRSTPPRRR